MLEDGSAERKKNLIILWSKCEVSIKCEAFNENKQLSSHKIILSCLKQSSEYKTTFSPIDLHKGSINVTLAFNEKPN